MEFVLPDGMAQGLGSATGCRAYQIPFRNSLRALTNSKVWIETFVVKFDVIAVNAYVHLTLHSEPRNSFLVEIMPRERLKHS